MTSFNQKDFEKYASKETMSKIVEIKTINELLDLMEKNYKGLPSIQKKDGSIAQYDEVLQDVKKVQKLLENEKIEKGTNVGIYCGNNYDFAISALGVMSYGCIAALIPVQVQNEILGAVSQKFELKKLLYEEALAANVPDSVNKYCITDIYSLEPSSEEYKNEPSDTACIIMTGGTTGKSKGAVLSHENVISGTINGCYGIDTVFNQVYYSIMPLTHVFGFIRNLLSSLYTGSQICFNVNKTDMFKDMQTYKPTVLVVVPALAEMFLKLINQFGIGMLGGNLKLIIAGGAAVPQYLVEEYNKLGVVLCPGYGLTELANMVSGNPIPLEKKNSVGMIFPGIEAKIVKDELWLKGVNLMKEYYKEPEENKNSFEDGWFKTGDLAKFDEDGFLYITGRIKDIIVLSNGENVSPAELEDKFNSLPFIQDSLVYDKDDKLILEVVIREKELANYAFEDKNEFVKSELDKINNELLAYQRVNEIIIRDTDFERSPSMKIIRPRRG